MRPIYGYHVGPSAQDDQEEGSIVKRIRARWEGVQARAVKKSEVMTWLASFKFGPPSYSLHLQTVRAVFRLAVDDPLIATNPVDGIKQKKLAKPIRQTPTLAEFQSVVDSIRAQKFSDAAKESADYVEFLGLAGLGQAEAETKYPSQPEACGNVQGWKFKHPQSDSAAASVGKR